MCVTLRNIALYDFTARQVSFPDCTGMRHTHLPFDIVCLAEGEPPHQHFTLCTLLWESEGKEEGGKREERGRKGGREREKKGKREREEKVI